MGRKREKGKEIPFLPPPSSLARVLAPFPFPLPFRTPATQARVGLEEQTESSRHCFLFLPLVWLACAPRCHPQILLIAPKKSYNARWDYPSPFTDPLCSQVRQARVIKTAGGFIDRQRKGVGAGKEENRRRCFRKEGREK